MRAGESGIDAGSLVQPAQVDALRRDRVRRGERGTVGERVELLAPEVRRRRVDHDDDEKDRDQEEADEQEGGLPLLRRTPAHRSSR